MGVKIAMPMCPLCLQYSFYGEDMLHTRFGHGFNVKVGDAIAYPARLRFLEANSRSIQLSLWNERRPEFNGGPFLEQSDLNFLAWNSLKLTLRKQGQRAPCWEGPRNAECLGLHELDVSGRRADHVVASMHVIERPYSRDYSQPGYVGSFSIFDTLYLAPADRPRDAIGLPMRFHCDWAQTCYNSVHDATDGFALRPNVQLKILFDGRRHPPEEWVAIHDSATQVIGTLLVE